MTLSPPTRHVTPVQGNTCPKCATALAQGRKRVYFLLPDCECTFPVPRINGPLCPNGGYTREQKEADLEYVEQFIQLSCSAALANGLIGGFEYNRRLKRFQRMEQKVKAMGMGGGEKAAHDELFKSNTTIKVYRG